jgi:sterol desaturase/sphingolipid hydroxylase (fatty acid hydroxylase superfamily)
MILTEREFWTLVHGMALGAVFLLAFAGGLAGIYSMRPGWVTVAGLSERIRRLNIGTVAMAVVSWLTVITGTFLVYPWYRARPPAGADLKDYPRYYLLDNPNLAAWHTFGMEWKEHVAWIAPIVATAIAFVIVRYGIQLAHEPQIRRALLWMFWLAFGTAGIAGLFGALITKAAPIL